MPDDTTIAPAELSPDDLAALTDQLEDPDADQEIVRLATGAEIILSDNAFDAELHLTAAGDGDHDQPTTIALRLPPTTVRNLHQQLLEVHRAQRSAAGIDQGPEPELQDAGQDDPADDPADLDTAPETQTQRFLNPLGPLLQRVTGTKKAQAAAALILVLLLLAWAIWRFTQ